MSKNLKFRAKVIKGLVDALDNEESYLRKYRLIGKVCGLLGGFIFTLILIASLHTYSSTITWFIVVSAISGLLIGLSLYFNSSAMQWPIIREFTNIEAIREAAKNEKNL